MSCNFIIPRLRIQPKELAEGAQDGLISQFLYKKVCLTIIVMFNNGKKLGKSSTFI